MALYATRNPDDEETNNGDYTPPAPNRPAPSTITPTRTTITPSPYGTGDYAETQTPKYSQTAVGGGMTHPTSPNPAPAQAPTAPAGYPLPAINRSDFQLPGADALAAQLAQRQADIASRQAPVAGPAAQVAQTAIGPASLAAATRLSPAQQALAVQLGPAAQAGAAGFGSAGSAGGASAAAGQLGPAAQTAGVTIDPARAAALAQLAGAAQTAGINLGPAAQAADSAYAARQAALADQLQRYATGQESVSQQQLGLALGKNVADQYALAASARPGQAAMAQRVAGQQAGRLGAGYAAQAALAGLQEREAMSNALGGVLSQARGQDIAQAQFNAAQQNQQAQAQGQLGAQIGIANTAQENARNALAAQLAQGAYNQNAQLESQRGIAQGQLSGQIGMSNTSQANAQAQALAQLITQANIASAGNATQAGIASAQNQTQMGIAQGQAAAQTAIANANAQNARDALAAQLAQSGSQFNATQANQMNLAGAQMAQQGAQFNAGQQQQVSIAQGQSDAARAALAAQLMQQQSQFGVTSGLQFQSQQDQARAQALAQQLSLAGAQQTGNVEYAKLAQENAYQQALVNEQWKQAQLNAQTQLDVAHVANPSPGFLDYLKALSPLGVIFK
jgi:hypothetical protein